MSKIYDYSTDFLSFFRDLYPVEGDYGPSPVIPPFLEEWLRVTFPLPTGNPSARNIMDIRTKKEGKSALAGAVALYSASRKPYSEVVIVASDRDQSRDRVLRSIKYALEHGPLAPHAKIYSNTVEIDNKSTILAMPNDWQGAAGGNYSCVVFDELASWVYEGQRRLFDEMLPPPTQSSGVRWIASYAGFEGESLLLKELWDKALQGERISTTLPIYRNEKASLLALIDTGPESWRMPWMSEEYIETIRQTERPNTFRRIWLNEWVSSESQFLPEGSWDACYSSEVKPLQVGDGRRVVLGADASTTRDLTSLVGVAYNPETGTSDVLFVRAWKPQKGVLRLGKPTVDLRETIGKEVSRLHASWQIDAIVCDPYQLHDLIIEWEKAGIRVKELPQTSGRVESDQGLYDAVVGRTLRHYGDAILNEHIKNAVAIETVRGFRLAKEKTSLKIDAAVALSMALYGAGDYRRMGGVTSLPNLFYDYEGATMDDFLKVNGNRYVYAPEAAHKPHPPGVTWRNCKRRMKGCQACVNELEAEGIDKEPENEGDYIGIPEGNRVRALLDQFNHDIGDREHEHKVISIFNRAISRKH